MHSESLQIIPKSKLRRIVSREKMLNPFPKYVPKKREAIEPKQETYFTGVHDTSNIRHILKDNNTTSFRAISVHSLEIIDSQNGAIMDGVFTLVHIEKGIHLTSKKRDTFGAFESLRKIWRFINSRGNSISPMSESSSKTHEEITTLFNVIEQFSLEHIPFDEVMGFWAAK
jgi:hypothetical protein